MYENCGAWVTRTTEFLQWYQGSTPPILWLHGYPGSGKSVIAKHIAQKALDSSPQSAVYPTQRNIIRAYFFCSFLSNKSQELKHLLSSLIYQIISQQPELEEGLSRKYPIITSQMLDSIATLFSMFRELLNTLRKWEDLITVYIIIDALDEMHDRYWARFCTEIADLLCPKDGNIPPVRLLVTSRPVSNLHVHLARYTSIDLSHNPSHALDVKRFISSSVMRYSIENNFDQNSISIIVSELSKRAGGMFLWASLAWDVFTSGVGTWTKSKIQERIGDLKHSSPGMNNLYQRVLSSFKGEEPEVKQILSWVVLANHPLTIEELSIALALRQRPTRVADIDQPMNLEVFLRQKCALFIDIDNNKVTLIHLSLKDYLLGTAQFMTEDGMVANPFYINFLDEQFSIAMDCICYIVAEEFQTDGEAFGKPTQEHGQMNGYLSFTDPWNTPDIARRSLIPLRNLPDLWRYFFDPWSSCSVRSTKQPFFKYAYRNWFEHASFQNDRAEELWVHFCKIILKDQETFRWYHKDFLIIKLWHRNLFHLFAPIANAGVDLNVHDGCQNHIIHTIVSNISKLDWSHLRYCLELGIDINGKSRYGQTLLHRCLTEWQGRLSDAFESEDVLADCSDMPHDERVFRMLLSLPGINVNVMDNFGHTPLTFAIYEGLMAPVDILLRDKRIDVSRGTTALHVAAAEGLLSVVERLLNRKAPVSSKNRYGDTALHSAASHGHQRVFQLLASYSHNFVLNAKNMYGWTATHQVTVCGNEDLLRWLVSNPEVNIDLRDQHGRKAIAFAAAHSSKDALECFLKRDPDQIWHEDLFGNTLLHMAAKGGNLENIVYLLTEHRHHLEFFTTYNQWGQTVSDCAQTKYIADYLLAEGFSHSEKYIFDEQVRLLENEALLVKKGDVSHSSAKGGAVVLTDRSELGPPQKSSDELGKRFNTAYATD